MTAKQQVGIKAPDGSDYVTLTDGAGNLMTVGGGGGSGTVTSVAVTTANGVSGVVANPTTTPAITVTLGAITPTTVTASGVITVPGTTNPVLTTSSAITSGAGALTGTLTNSPVTGNPTKWVPINDNGTTRYIPAW